MRSAAPRSMPRPGPPGQPGAGDRRGWRRTGTRGGARRARSGRGPPAGLRRVGPGPDRRGIRAARARSRRRPVAPGPVRAGRRGARPHLGGRRPPDGAGPPAPAPPRPNPRRRRFSFRPASAQVATGAPGAGARFRAGGTGLVFQHRPARAPAGPPDRPMRHGCGGTPWAGLRLHARMRPRIGAPAAPQAAAGRRRGPARPPTVRSRGGGGNPSPALRCVSAFPADARRPRSGERSGAARRKGGNRGWPGCAGTPGGVTPCR